MKEISIQLYCNTKCAERIILSPNFIGVYIGDIYGLPRTLHGLSKAIRLPIMIKGQRLSVSVLSGF